MEKILNMFVVPFRLKEPLSWEDINAIRYHLFPEVRISGEYSQQQLNIGSSLRKEKI
ncbi:hypothetical protein ACIQAA_19020 [Neobacillus sp. NPDC093182]|uniref:hypothetical protein n=1 Tax=Neobacillus sp. NPDC093182 TaxID=3364297 RepID=UPI003800D7DD